MVARGAPQLHMAFLLARVPESFPGCSPSTEKQRCCYPSLLVLRHDWHITCKGFSTSWAPSSNHSPRLLAAIARCFVHAWGDCSRAVQARFSQISASKHACHPGITFFFFQFSLVDILQWNKNRLKINLCSRLGISTLAQPFRSSYCTLHLYCVLFSTAHQTKSLAATA